MSKGDPAGGLNIALPVVAARNGRINIAARGEALRDQGGGDFLGNFCVGAVYPYVDQVHVC